MQETALVGGSHKFGGLTIARAAIMSGMFTIVLLCQTVMSIYYTIDARTLLNVDYTFCMSQNSNVTCQSAIGQMSAFTPSGQTCKCRLEFDLGSDQQSSQVNVYYGMKNFNQNYRFLAQSVDYKQYGGDLKAVDSPSNRCKLITGASSNNSSVPCGALANLMFDDDFTLSSENATTFEMDRYDIPIDRTRKYQFRNPPEISSLNKHNKPPRWQRSIAELDSKSQNVGFENGPFIVWMITSAFGHFTKMHSIIRPSQGLLKKGRYALNIDYRFGSYESAENGKFVTIQTISGQGTRNLRLLISVSLLSVAYFFVSMGFYFVWKRYVVSGQDLSLGL